MLRRINRLTVPFVFGPTVCTYPDVLVRDLIGMFSSHVDAAMGKSGGAFPSPTFEFFAVGVVLDVADHEVEEVTIFMGDDVDEAVL